MIDMGDLLSGQLQDIKSDVVSNVNEEIRKMKLEMTISNPFFIVYYFYLFI
jgi:hypothetical protein